MLKAALDTSTGISFAVIDSNSNEIIIDRRENLKHGALALLADLIKAELQEKSIDLADIKEWSVGTGPGSFTGIRIGIGFVKAACLACGSNYRGISTSYALAASIPTPTSKTTVAVVYDGRKKELLCDTFIHDGHTVSRLTDAKVLAENEINDTLQQCDIIVTLHEKPATLLLNEENQQKLCAFDTLNSVPLCTAKKDFQPASREEMEESCHPVYVRPAVFVPPKVIREVK